MKNRIVSLVPSATEMVGGLTQERGRLVGVTHECDHPEWVRSLPKVVHPADPSILTAPPAEVDEKVSASIGRAESLYRLDLKTIAALEPDLVVTQGLCDVCAVSPGDLAKGLASIPSKPKVLELTPMSLADVLEDVIRVGSAIGEENRANRWRAELERRLERIASFPPLPGVNRVLALEWADPLWAAGHWVPEMISLAGGVSVLGEPDQPSTRIEPDSALASKPDFVLLMGCGHDALKNEEIFLRLLEASPFWRELMRACEGRVFALDANTYFSRPAPRLVEGVEILARLLRGMEIPKSQCRRTDCEPLPISSSR